MVFDRLNLVPAFQYKFSTIISPWELHCFYLAARTYKHLSYNWGEKVGEEAERAVGVIITTLESYSTGWKIAGEG